MRCMQGIIRRGNGAAGQHIWCYLSISTKYSISQLECILIFIISMAARVPYRFFDNMVDILFKISSLYPSLAFLNRLFRGLGCTINTYTQHSS